MRARFLSNLARSEDAAVAPIVAISLFGLIAVGSIAFDYARMATLDTELQQAADQAALAAATQLDGRGDSMDRANTAASNLVQNQTLFANEAGGTRNVTVSTTDPPVFYSAYDSASDSGTVITGTTSDDQKSARFVQVTITAREAFFALTPIVQMFSSGALSAHAIAGLGSGICNVPPLMICQPSDDFPTSADIGKGLLLQPGPKIGSWAPGDYGYLDFGNGKSGLKTNLGANSDALNCMSGENVPTEPGNAASAPLALNTRLDMYAPSIAKCDTTTGDDCPAANTRKDTIRIEEVAIKLKSTDPKPAHPQCDYKDPNATIKITDFDLNSTHPARGFTRDTCHATTCAGGNFGDGIWDRATYFANNHPGQLSAAAAWAGKSETQLGRYDIYKWELADSVNRMADQLLNPSDPAVEKVQGANTTYTFTNYCAYSRPINGSLYSSSTPQKDRRLLTVAVVDCSGLNGKGSVKVQKWVDIFLVEPSLKRTSPYNTEQAQIYGEVVGVATKPDGSNAFQYYSHNKPYLVK